MGALFTAAIGFLLKAVVVQFFVFTAIYLLISTAVPILISQLFPQEAMFGDGGLETMVNDMPAGVLFFLDYFQVITGMSLILAALGGRFILRRIPFLN